MAYFRRLGLSQSVCRTLSFSRVKASLSRTPSLLCINWKYPIRRSYWSSGLVQATSPLTSRARVLCIASQYLQKRSYYSERFWDELNSAQSVDRVLDVFVTHRDALDPVGVSQCLHTLLRVAKTQRTASVLSEHPGVNQFLEYVINRVPHFPVHVAAVCLHNCSKYHFHNDELLSCLIDVCSQQPLSPKSMGLVLSALVRLGHHSETQQLFIDAAKQLASWLEMKEFHISPGALTRMVYLLLISGNWVDELNSPLLAYLETHIPEWDNLHLLSLTIWTLVRQKVIHRSPVLLAEAGNVASELLHDDTNPQNTTMLSWAFGSLSYYHKDYFEALSEKITTSSPGFLEPRLLSTVAWACSKVRYYNPSLLDCIAEHSMAKLSQFNSQDLGNLAYTFGRLNYQTPLLTAIAQRLESDPKLIANIQALYNVAWACMVLDVYPHKLLQHALSPKCIQGMLENNSEFTSFYDLMQLHVAVTVEHPELQIAGISKSQIKEVTLSVLKYVQQKYATSTFEVNVHRALKRLTGGDYSCITSQPMTTHGYFLDAELLLNGENKPIKIPRAWKYRRYHTMEKILQHGSSVFTESESVSLEEEKSIDFDSLLGSLKKAEVNHQHTDCDINSDAATNFAESADNLVAMLHSYPATEDVRIFVNLASDWQDIVQNPTSEPVARRIAIEADGPWHYAINCRHVLGHTTLKQRQLEALGWEVIPVQYFEWEPLESDQDHVQFLAKKLFGH